MHRFAYFCLNGSTFDFNNHLTTKHPDINFSYVIGQDNADNIEMWIRHEYLVNNLRFLVVPRGGDIPPDVWYTQNPHGIIEVSGFNDVSSTRAREIITTNFLRNEESISFNAIRNLSIFVGIDIILYILRVMVNEIVSEDANE